MRKRGARSSQWIASRKLAISIENVRNDDDDVATSRISSKSHLLLADGHKREIIHAVRSLWKWVRCMKYEFATYIWSNSSSESITNSNHDSVTSSLTLTLVWTQRSLCEHAKKLPCMALIFHLLCCLCVAGFEDISTNSFFYSMPKIKTSK